MTRETPLQGHSSSAFSCCNCNKGASSMAGPRYLILLSAVCCTLCLAILTLAFPSKRSGTVLFSSSGFDYYRPSWHTFDYTRPDYDVGLEYGQMNGNIGFSGPVIADEQKAWLGPWSGPIITKQASPSISLFQRRSPWMTASQLDLVQQDRSEMSSDQRAEAARCHGILHACENWMALHATQMRVVLFKEGRWCTDDVLTSKACYKKGGQISEDVVLQVPEEGEPISEQLWQFIMQGCPMLGECPKPEKYSSTEATSVYRGSLQALAAAALEERKVMDQAACCSK